jgi:D-arabinose 1-dehydrogenase-like Zn-dependent alcohol dehydrogenase
MARFFGGERQIRSVANMTPQGAGDLVALARDFRLSVATFPFTEANQALQEVEHESATGSAVFVS